MDEVAPIHSALPSTVASSSSVRSIAILTHEEAVARNPFALRPWLHYLAFLAENKSAPLTSCFFVYERAVATLPGCYKLWLQYAEAFRSFADTHHPLHPARRAALDVSARAARTLRASPVLWVRYVKHALDECRLREARDAVDSALQLLPLTQHNHVWDVIRDHYPMSSAPLAAAHLFNRYAQLAPGPGTKLYLAASLAGDAVQAFVTRASLLLSNASWKPHGEARHDVWTTLARTAVRHASRLPDVDVAMLINTAIAEGGPNTAQLWVLLSELHTRQLRFDSARETFETALATISVARDFAIVFDAYTQLEESLIVAAMDRVSAADDGVSAATANEAVEEHMSRLESLVNRRAMLLSDVRLRQNPHNVHEWHRRVRMFKAESDALNVVDTYTKAVQTVDPWRATNGRPHTLWLAFAQYYEQENELESARRVLEQATGEPDGFRRVEDLAAVWCEFAEMELRQGDLQRAADVLRRATKRSGVKESSAASRDDRSSARFAFCSRRLWHFLIDVEQSLGDADTVLEVHSRSLELRVASPRSVLSGARFFESRRLFERAFRLYDRAVGSLPWSDAVPVWTVYVARLSDRYATRAPERVEEAFEQVISAAPPVKNGRTTLPNEHLKHLYLQYAGAMERSPGSARRVVQILARGARAVREAERASMYRLYIVKVATTFGVTKTRAIFEEALTSMRDAAAVTEFAVRYARLEWRIGEIERARAVFAQSCAAADTRRGGTFAAFWTAWEEFETVCGTEDTVREMLRERRYVQMRQRDVLGEAEWAGPGGITNMVSAGVMDGRDGCDDAADADAAAEAGAAADGAEDSAQAGGTEGDASVAVEAGPASESEGEFVTAGGGAKQGEQCVVQELPPGVRELVSAARAHAAQHAVRTEGEETGTKGEVDGENSADRTVDGAGNGGGGDDVDVAAASASAQTQEVVGALERFKRKRLASTM